MMNDSYELLEYDIEMKCYNEYINNIGMIYEYYTEAGPRGINGNPIFYSCRFLSKSDCDKMIEFYNIYKEKRELVDQF